MRKCVHCDGDIVLTTDRGWMHIYPRNSGRRHYQNCEGPTYPNTKATPEPDKL